MRDFTSCCFQTATLRSWYVFWNVSVSRRFFGTSRLGLEGWTSRSRLGLEGSRSRSRLGLESLKKWNVSVLKVDRLGLVSVLWLNVLWTSLVGLSFDVGTENVNKLSLCSHSGGSPDGGRLTVANLGSLVCFHTCVILCQNVSVLY